MRLIEVAKRLGMTGQQLRHELTQVDFGVKPTDREISPELAQGIVRFLARKYGIEVKEELAAAAPPEEGEEREEKEEEKIEASAAQVSSTITPGERAPPSPEVPVSPAAAARKVHVLRKLSLEGVPAGAGVTGLLPPRPAPKKILTKAEKEEQRREQKLERMMKKQTIEAQQQIKRKEGIVELPDPITVKEFAEKTGVQVPLVISTLMKNGVLATINQRIDFETAAIVAAEIGVVVKKVEARASAERLLAGNLKALLAGGDPSLLEWRPPIVTVMGHVDHGKTAILDAIRKTNVAASEAGGITQRIGAYEVKCGEKSITFLDTPGHEAFTAMRARGAQITDIVVLVVAADEGVQPTTVEAIHHAREAGVPILVALNKIDKEGADPDRVKGELAKAELQPEEWGGKTPVVLCSAKTGQGIESLLEHILVLAEMGNLTCNHRRPAVATVIEGHLDASLGPVASLIVNAGRLEIGDTFVYGLAIGRVKSMVDAWGRRCESVGPSGAVRIAGLPRVPEAGDILQVVSNDQEAKALLTELREATSREKKWSWGDLITRLSEGKLTVLKIVLKVDSGGSLEALEEAIGTLETEGKVVPKIIHGGVGNITEGDVMMAAASGGMVLGFNVHLPTHVEKVAGKLGIEVRLYDVIYKLLEEISALLQGLVEPEEEMRILGHIEVRGVFFAKKSEQIIGGKVLDGVLKRVPFRIVREGKEVGTGRITSLKHIDRDIKEAKEGSECGMRVEISTPIVIGDHLEAYVKEFKRKAAV